MSLRSFALPTLALVFSFVGRAALADVALTFGSDIAENKEVSAMVSSNTKLTSAIQAFQQGNFGLCEQLLIEAAKDSKDLPAVDLMLSRMLLNSGRYQDALVRLESYSRKNDKDAEAHASLGEVALRSGRFSDAWLQFREAMTLLPSSNLSKARKEDFTLRLTQLRAETAEGRGDFDAAKQLYEELQKLLPKSGYPLWSLGRLLVAQDKMDEGFDLLKKAKALTSDLPQPELQMANAIANSGMEEEKRIKLAQEWYKKSLLASETSGYQNWFDFASWFLKVDRPEDARLLISKADKDFSSKPAMKFLDAFALRYLGKNQESELALSELLDETPGIPEAMDQLALLLIESPDQGKKVRAQQLAQSNLQRAPNYENAMATYAWIEYRLGNVAVANQVFGEILTRGTSNPQVCYYLGRWLDSMKAPEESVVQAYELAVQLPGYCVQRAGLRKTAKDRREQLERKKKAAESKDKDKSTSKTETKKESVDDKSKSSAGKDDKSGAKSGKDTTPAPASNPSQPKSQPPSGSKAPTSNPPSKSGEKSGAPKS
jgi:tetratricopeptide (TPR) repeat protein